MGALLNRAAQLMCPHGGKVQITTTNTKTKAGGDYVVRAGDTYLITGCPFVVGIPPHPCVSIRWVVTAFQSKAVSDSCLTTDSVGLCIAADQAVQGTVTIVNTQQVVSGK
jgi:hypothetical protein